MRILAVRASRIDAIGMSDEALNRKIENRRPRSHWRGSGDACFFTAIRRELSRLPAHARQPAADGGFPLFFAYCAGGENSPLMHPSRKYRILPQPAATLLSWVTIRMVAPF